MKLDAANAAFRDRSWMREVSASTKIRGPSLTYLLGRSIKKQKVPSKLPHRAAFKAVFNPRRWDEEVGSSTTNSASHPPTASQVSH
jgi:hypothetical protein